MGDNRCDGELMLRNLDADDPEAQELQAMLVAVCGWVSVPEATIQVGTVSLADIVAGRVVRDTPESELEKRVREGECMCLRRENWLLLRAFLDAYFGLK